MSPELKAAMKAMSGTKHGYIFTAAERSALDSRIDKLEDAFGSEAK